jgi:hypothetical protein
VKRFMCPGNHDGGDGSAGNGMAGGILNYPVSRLPTVNAVELVAFNQSANDWSGKMYQSKLRSNQ